MRSKHTSLDTGVDRQAPQSLLARAYPAVP